MTDLAALHDADDRFLTVVGGLNEQDLRAPSLLPGWSRGHVIAHVALNGEAYRGALRSVIAGEPACMYASAEARDRDIDVLAAASADELVARCGRVAAELLPLFDRLGPEHAEAVVSRLPDGTGMTFPADQALEKRLGEVWIHLADLGTPSFSHHDWPAPFSSSLVATRAGRHPEWAFEASDTEDRWGASASALVISGAVADLAWWLTGRGEGDGLTTSTGELPGPPRF